MGYCKLPMIGGGAKFPVGGEIMSGTSGTGNSPAAITKAIDVTKKYYINAAGANSTTSSPGVAGKLWLYDGKGGITSVKSNWTANNNFTCVLSGDNIVVKNTLSGGYGSSYQVTLLVTIIPLE